MTEQQELGTRVQAWLSEIGLVGVDVLDVEGHRHHETNDSEIQEFDGDYESKFAIGLDETDNAHSFRVRVRLTIEFPFGSVKAEIGLVYQSDDRPIKQMADDEMHMFINDVAFMAAFPYLRAEIAQLTSKLYKFSLTLPIVQRGDVTFNPQPKSS